jgi:uncharacterized integral membrane protein
MTFLLWTATVVVVLALLMILFPVSAHSMAGGVDYVNGIDDLWPIHATLMTAGIASMLMAMGNRRGQSSGLLGRD